MITKLQKIKCSDNLILVGGGVKSQNFSGPRQECSGHRISDSLDRVPPHFAGSKSRDDVRLYQDRVGASADGDALTARDVEQVFERRQIRSHGYVFVD